MGGSRGLSGRSARRSARQETPGSHAGGHRRSLDPPKPRPSRASRGAPIRAVVCPAKPAHPRGVRRRVHCKSHGDGHHAHGRREQGVQQRHHPVHEAPHARRRPRSHEIRLVRTRRRGRHRHRGRRVRLHRGGSRDGATQAHAPQPRRRGAAPARLHRGAVRAPERVVPPAQASRHPARGGRAVETGEPPRPGVARGHQGFNRERRRRRGGPSAAPGGCHVEPPRVRFPRGQRVRRAGRPHLREHRPGPRVRPGRRTAGVRVGARDGPQDRAARRGARVDRDSQAGRHLNRVGACGYVRDGFFGRSGDGVRDGGRGGGGGAGGHPAVQQGDGVRGG